MFRRPRALSPAAEDSEPLGVLFLPDRLEEFELAGHARDLLEIPRVVAVEPARFTPRRLMGEDVVAFRQARRLRFPGTPRVVVLYHPRQYRLARALAERHEAQLWYFRGTGLDPRHPDAGTELTLLDELACEAAAQVLALQLPGDPRVDNRPLRDRLVELEIISHRPFVPGARVRVR